MQWFEWVRQTIQKNYFMKAAASIVLLKAAGKGLLLWFAAFNQSLLYLQSF
jgi:hypothetical protein